MYDDAMRIAREYRPGDIQTIDADLGRVGSSRPRTAKPGDQLVKQAREREEQSDYVTAVQLYLRCEEKKILTSLIHEFVFFT